jgi:uncharacterized protein YukE
MANGDQQQMTVGTMQKLSTDYQSNATRCQDIAHFLQSPLATMFWQSQAANSFRQEMDGYIKMLNGFSEGFTTLSNEITKRVGELQSSKNV